MLIVVVPLPLGIYFGSSKNILLAIHAFLNIFAACFEIIFGFLAMNASYWSSIKVVCCDQYYFQILQTSCRVVLNAVIASDVVVGNLIAFSSSFCFFSICLLQSILL